MNAIINIKNTITGIKRTMGVVINKHIDGATIETVLSEFIRQTGKAPVINENETFEVEAR